MTNSEDVKTKEDKSKEDDLPQNKPKEAKIRESEREKQKKEFARLFPPIPGFRLMRTIVVLVLIILLLLSLLWFYGLGGGGRGVLPGGSSGSSPQAPIQAKETAAVPPESKSPARRELNISFIPSAADAEAARELACNVSWTDAATGSSETRAVSEENMADFEFALEKIIRAWCTAPGSTKQDTLIVAVRMTPFPGEGTLQKMTRIVHGIDSKINILRIEK